LKHVFVFILLAFAIYFLAIRKTDLDVLMVPVTNYTDAQVGNRFVDVDPSRLPITPQQLAEPGVITVVYFHDDTCAGCLQLDQNLNEFLPIRPDVAVRKIRISPGNNGYSKAIKDYQWRIYMSPCILIYGKNGKLIAADDRTNSAGQDLLEKWIYRELYIVAKMKKGYT
jgi:hypothetical protein